MAPVKRSYTPQQVSARLGVCSQTVQRWVDAGRLQAWKTLGGHRRIDADSADALMATQLAPSLPVRPPRVLVVDDRPLDAALLSEHVRAVFPGAQVMLARDGFEGLMMVGTEPPDLVLVDLAMPHMNGVEMIRRMQARLEPVPAFLIVSALQPPEIQALGGLPDGVPLLSKPVDPGVCRQLLRAALPARATVAVA